MRIFYNFRQIENLTLLPFAYDFCAIFNADIIFVYLTYRDINNLTPVSYHSKPKIESFFDNIYKAHQSPKFQYF